MKNLRVEEARSLLLRAVRPVEEEEEVELWEAYDRVLARDAVAGEDIPSFDRSAMDGYALRSGDTLSPPARLRVVGEVPAGRVWAGRLDPGTVVAISTGAPLPPDADAVIRQEEASEEEGWVLIRRRVEEGENVSPRGEDLRAGVLALRRGTLIRAQEMGILASLGWARVPVFARVRAGVVATGDEVVNVDEPAGPGQVRNSTAHLLGGLLRRAGALPFYLGRVPDKAEEIRRAIEQNLDRFHLLFTTGGVSVGRHDLLPRLVEEMGGRTLFWRVEMKPGRNIVAAEMGGRMLIGLSGNPAAALTTFELVVRPFVLALGRRPAGGPLETEAVVDRDLGGLGGTERYLRAAVRRRDGEFHASPLWPQLPSVLSSFSGANGFIRVPKEKVALRAGEKVTVVLPAPEDAFYAFSAGEEG